jgi:hypothetical protein
MIDMTYTATTLRRRVIGWAISALACPCWLCVAAHAGTQTACVRCSGPERIYRCNVMSDDTVPSEATRYFCMSQIARDHVHESCSVLRGAASCDGVDVGYVYQDGAGDQPTGSARAAPSAPAEANEPGVLADITRSAVEASIKAGQVVGEATKRTWKCLGAALNGC